MIDWQALLIATGFGIIMVACVIGYHWRKYTKRQKKIRKEMIDWYESQIKE
jgi:hypothetical protein